jgi:hypothetical protein
LLLDAPLPPSSSSGTTDPTILPSR